MEQEAEAVKTGDATADIKDPDEVIDEMDEEMDKEIAGGGSDFNPNEETDGGGS
jgi:hypothetical protein